MPRDPFYVSWDWKKLRRKILAIDKHECQHCKARGRYKRADTVHHVKEKDKYPELALSEFYIDDNGKEQRNLISLCRECHEKVHGYRHEVKEPLTPERW